MTRVLLVEDEESFSDALSYLLRKQGFQVAVCPAGPDALEVFDRDGADVVLLDLMLPGPAGTDVCQSLRQRSDVPVIMLTAKDSEAGKAVGLGLGADDYVTKPFTWRELAARIRAVLPSRKESGESPAAADETAPGPSSGTSSRHVCDARPWCLPRQDLQAELCGRDGQASANDGAAVRSGGPEFSRDADGLSALAPRRPP